MPQLGTRSRDVGKIRCGGVAFSVVHEMWLDGALADEEKFKNHVANIQRDAEKGRRRHGVVEETERANL